MYVRGCRFPTPVMFGLYAVFSGVFLEHLQHLCTSFMIRGFNACPLSSW